MVFNATFSNISVTSWEYRLPQEKEGIMDTVGKSALPD